MSREAKPKGATRKAKTKSRTVPASSPATTFPIVAIGASAGGLEAFTNLLHALPPDPGLALVVIPHLDPTHESAMVELLSRATRLPVLQAVESMRVAPNCVYVIPPNFDMTISNGVLHLGKREGGRGHHMPIDTFLRSLAEDQTTNAVGVILSGTANDGTLGLAAVKNEGGVTFAQDSESAKYDGMPTSAASAGVVDFILPPDRIAKELLRIQVPPAERDSRGDAFYRQEGPLREIFRLLRAFSKVDFGDYKSATIRRRILRRMNITQTEELADYVKLLHRSPQEVEALYRDVLINVTSFFRNPEVFESLRELVYPKILANRSPSEPVRAWVPGCSTGEETYSHAISLVETLSELRIEVPIQIFGTDLSESAIQKARVGIYKDAIANDVPPAYFEKETPQANLGTIRSASPSETCACSRGKMYSTIRLFRTWI